MDELLNLNIPTPEKVIAANQLLADGETSYHGLIRKLKQDGKGFSAMFKNLLTPTRPVLVILNRGCLYYFNDEMARKPRGAYTLYGYNRIIRAEDLQTEKRPWVFQIEHASPCMETLVFSTISKQEMEKWMVAIKKEMLIANRSSMRGKKLTESLDRDPGDGKDDSLSDFVEQPIYDDLHDVTDLVDATLKKLPYVLGQCTDDDGVEEEQSYLEFEAARPSEDDNDYQRMDNLSNKPLPSIPKKEELVKPRLFGKGTVPKVPMVVPSKADLESIKKPVPGVPGDMKLRTRSEPEGKSFCKSDEKAPDPPAPRVPDRPTRGDKPLLSWQKKRSADKVPEVPPWNPQIAENKPDLSLRKVSEVGPPPPVPAGKPRAMSLPQNKLPSPPSPAASYSLLKSVKKPTFTKEDVARDSTLYWKCHMFDGTKEEGLGLLNELGSDGVYLVRDGAGGNLVLVVYYNSRTNKYVIKHQEGKYFICDSDKAETLEEMLYLYHTTNLPNKDHCLTQPYLLAVFEAEDT